MISLLPRAPGPPGPPGPPGRFLSTVGAVVAEYHKPATWSAMDRNVEKWDDFRLKVSWRWDSFLTQPVISIYKPPTTAYNHLQSMDTSSSSPPSPRDLRGGRRHRSAGCKFLHLWAQGFQPRQQGIRGSHNKMTESWWDPKHPGSLPDGF